MAITVGTRSTADAVVIGGGFYGCAIAVYLARQRGFKQITLLEREAALLSRASYHNQARVHNGYHYPRSYTTAYRSRVNLPRFVRDWSSAVKQDFTQVYAIARSNSKVTSRQFQRFCTEIGARLEPADESLRKHFEPRLIEDVFVVEEYAFDATQLARLMWQALAECGVKLVLGRGVSAVRRIGDGRLNVILEPANEPVDAVAARYVFNCTYSALNQLGGDFPGTASGLKHELTEMALVEMPVGLREFGVTIMDGAFFSAMPFPPRNLHTLSHVRYTPHLHWIDDFSVDPYRRLRDHGRASRFERMRRDAARYVPMLAEARYVDSLFEVKTVLVKSEGDDGRPILFERHPELGGCFSVLGGKIDNIYDVLEKLDAEHFDV
ncbi:MAG: FAD-dependent oxidoreductase [Thiotrichales bacterium]